MSDDPTMLVVERRGRGRPSRAGVRATSRVEFVATDQEKAELRRVADENGKKVATVIREAVNEYVADYRERRVFPPYPVRR